MQRAWGKEIMEPHRQNPAEASEAASPAASLRYSTA